MGADIREFGITAAGQRVEAVHLSAGEMRVVVLTRGAVLQDLRLAGLDRSLTLGSDRLADYEGALRYHGALVGPVANRINGGVAPIAGSLYRFETNEAGRHMLHSGSSGTHCQVWDILAADSASVTLGIDLADGEGGFPGNRHVEVRFDALAPASLRMTITATTDAPTLMNFANHSYWNLDGTPNWEGHSLRIAAEHFLPVTGELIPTGQITPVEGTGYDLRTDSMIAIGHPPLDTNFCLSDARMPLRDVLWLRGKTGVTMTLATTEPGLQVYDGRAALRSGRNHYEGLAIEPQFWPDAPNHPGFPPIELKPGQGWRQETVWKFTRG